MSYVPALIGALGAVGSGFLTANSLDNQNAAATNQFAANLAFQRYQYEDSKRWQSMPNQVRLLRYAGLNPSLALGNQSGISPVGGVAPTSSMTSADYSGLPSAASQLMSGIASSDVEESAKAANYASAANQLQESVNKSIKNAFEHGNQVFGQRLTQLEGQLAETQLNLQLQTMDNAVLESYWKAEGVRAATGAQLLANKWIDDTKSAELGQLIANLAFLRSQKKLTDKQSEQVVMSTIANYGLDKDDAYDLFDASMDYLDEQTNNQSSSSMSNLTSGFTKLGIPVAGAGQKALQQLQRFKYNQSRQERRKRIRDSKKVWKK